MWVAKLCMAAGVLLVVLTFGFVLADVDPATPLVSVMGGYILVDAGLDLRRKILCERKEGRDVRDTVD